MKIISCEYENCGQVALYNETNIYPAKRCEQHKHDDDIHLFEEKCSSCGLDMLLDENKLCCYCNVNLKRFETEVSDYIKRQFPYNFVSNDKIVVETRYYLEYGIILYNNRS